MENLYEVALSLYDGDWRAEDREQLISEYDLTEDEADEICEDLAYIADRLIKEKLINDFCLTKDEAEEIYKNLSDFSAELIKEKLLREYDLTESVAVEILAQISEFVDKLIKVQGVIGVNYTFPNYYQLQCIKRLNGGNINVINGPDESLLCGLAMGADGGIGTTYNVMAPWFVKLYERFSANDVMGAQEMQYRINRVIDVLLGTNLIPAVRVALEEMGFDVGFSAAPARRFDAVGRKGLIDALRAAGLFEIAP